MKPTIFLTNWASKKYMGEGHRYSIMAWPRSWEKGEGVVQVLVPPRRLLDEYKKGLLTIEEYKWAFLETLKYVPLQPGTLCAQVTFADWPLVADGDTLLCGCSKKDADAGRCHRVWVAPLLAAAGWEVVLDGRTVD